MQTPESMFYQGDIQSGIGLAIRERKCVACFVRDDGELSDLWERAWISSNDMDPELHASIAQILSAKTVLLRLRLHSQEAQLLNEFCPVATAPTLIIIRNNQVVDTLNPDVEARDFVTRLAQAVQWVEIIDDIEGVENTPHIDGTHSTANTSHDLPSTRETSETIQQASMEAATSAEEPARNESLSQDATHLHSLFPDRAERLETEKKRREAAEKAEKAARAEARRREREEASAKANDKGKQKETRGDAGANRARQDWLVEQKRRKDEAKRDRERVLAQLEADKAERRARAPTPRETLPAEPVRDSLDAQAKRRHGAGAMCTLTVRLLDGSTVKGRFEPTTTLTPRVRSWIQEEVGHGNTELVVDTPYTFKHVLTPLPSRDIEVSDESLTLQELQLVPHATLMLVFDNRRAMPYAMGGGILSKLLNSIRAVISYLYTIIAAMLSIVIPASGSDSVHAEPTTAHSAQSGGSQDDQTMSSSEHHATNKRNVVTLADQPTDNTHKGTSDAEFYNGNSLDFEKRPDDDKGDKKDV